MTSTPFARVANTSARIVVENLRRVMVAVARPSEVAVEVSKVVYRAPGPETASPKAAENSVLSDPVSKRADLATPPTRIVPMGAFTETAVAAGRRRSPRRRRACLGKVRMRRHG